MYYQVRNWSRLTFKSTEMLTFNNNLYNIMEFLKFYNKWKWHIREFNFLIRRLRTYIGQCVDNKLLIVTLKSMSLRRNNCSFTVTIYDCSLLMKPVIGDDNATKLKRDLFTSLLTWFLNKCSINLIQISYQNRHK